MKTMQKITALLLALLMAFACTATAYAEDGETVPPLESLDTSAINGRQIAFRGVETYFVVYPQPEEAESRFDVRNAIITCDREDVVQATADENEEGYRFGSVNILGLKYGSANVTVTDPASGISCSVKIIVVPAFPYYLLRFMNSLNYLPYFLFMKIASIFLCSSDIK